MATRKRTTKKSTQSLRWGPEGAKQPTRAQITSIIMETFPNPRSGLPFKTVGARVGALYQQNAVKRHVQTDVPTLRQAGIDPVVFGRSMKVTTEFRGQDEIAREYSLCMEAIPDMKIEAGKPRFLRDGQIEIDWVLTGTHTGEFRGVPPSGKRVRIVGTERFTMEGTLIKQHDVASSYDALGWNGIIVGAKRPTKPLFPKHRTDRG
jgi:hypothetical protein